MTWLKRLSAKKTLARFLQKTKEYRGTCPGWPRTVSWIHFILTLWTSFESRDAHIYIQNLIPFVMISLRWWKPSLKNLIPLSWRHYKSPYQTFRTICACTRSAYPRSEWKKPQLESTTLNSSRNPNFVKDLRPFTKSMSHLEIKHTWMLLLCNWHSWITILELSKNGWCL